MRLGSFVAAFVLAACRRPAPEGEKIVKPVDTAPPGKASASRTLPIEVTAPRCLNGSIVAEVAGAGDADAPSGAGGLGLSAFPPDSGWGDGIGLGTVGGGFARKPRTTLKGQVLEVSSGLLRDAVEAVLCAAHPTFTTCVDEAATLSAGVDGTVGLALIIDADGHAMVKASGGTLGDPKLTACLEAAAKALTFATKTSGTATYALEAHRDKKVKLVKMLEAGTAVVGRLPPEVVKRIVRANFPRLRACYEAELKKDPAVKGTVITKFVIDTTGAIDGLPITTAGTLSSPTMNSCVAKVFGALSFPEPEGGKVMVTYPVDFKNED